MIKSLLIFLPATLMPRLATFALSLIGANILTANEFGYFALVVIIGEMSEMSAVGWTRVLLIRYGSSEAGLSRQTMKRVSLASSGSLLTALVVASLLSFILAPERFTEMAIATSAYVSAFGILRIGLTTLQIEDRKFTYSILESCRAPLFIVGVAVMMKLTHSFSYASIVGSVVVLLLGLFALSTGWKNAISTSDPIISWTVIFRAGIPIILISLMSYIVVSLDKMILSLSFSKDMVAIYAIAFALGRQGFDVLANAINVYAFPLLVRQQKKFGNEGVKGQVQNTFTLILAVTLPAAGILIASRNFIAGMILPEQYHGAIDVALPFIAVGAILMNLKNFCFDNIFHIYEKNYYQLPTLAIGAGTSIIVAIWSPTQNALMDAAFIYTSGAAASLLSSALISRRFLAITIPWALMSLIATWSCAAFFGSKVLLLSTETLWVSVGAILCAGVVFMGGSLLLYRRYELSPDS